MDQMQKGIKQKVRKDYAEEQERRQRSGIKVTSTKFQAAIPGLPSRVWGPKERRSVRGDFESTKYRGKDRKAITERKEKKEARRE